MDGWKELVIALYLCVKGGGLSLLLVFRVAEVHSSHSHVDSGVMDDGNVLLLGYSGSSLLKTHLTSRVCYIECDQTCSKPVWPSVSGCLSV